jgi:(1->4)-alpha-D-glucan 1-alpha-D-glucosylmutase
VVPTATYRLQFRAGFTLRDATALIPYLHALGVSHVYCSSYLKARASSTHGYDIVDHNALNPEIGDEADFEAFVAALRAHGMGQILDFVPNHMGIGQAENAWWLDMLEYGDASPHARAFDIDWQPQKPELHGRVVLPVLGAHYGAVLEAGALRLGFDAETGGFDVRYHEHRFPIRPRRFGMILDRIARHLEQAAALRALATQFDELRTRARSEAGRTTWRGQAERLKRELAALIRAEPGLKTALDTTLAAINGPEQGPCGDPTFLHRLLERQAYRLAFWRVSAHEINYRRFFDINDLAGIRVEDPAVFDAVHRRVLQWIGTDKVDGLRIDHIDGLYDPEAYCRRLRDQAADARRAASAADPDRPLYVLVEKILAPHETLRETWPIAGTTGYEVLNQINGVLVDPAGERPLDRAYARFVGGPRDFDTVLAASKARAMNNELASELNVLANRLDRLTEEDWDTRDYTLAALRDALLEVVVYFSVYRTYITARGAAADDRRDIGWAVGQARKRSASPDKAIFDFIHDALTADLARRRDGRYNRREALRFAMKFQQYTGPVMAKSMEDTAFYRYHRLVSLNEVGGDPPRFGFSPAAFHRANEERQRRWPHTMVSTATHDTKRGEDMRTRIDVLSERPREWAARVRRWAVLNRRLKVAPGADKPSLPDADDEYLIYQTLLGAWPLELLEGEDAGALERFRVRMEAYLLKALRESKRHSSWTNPDDDYEQATCAFLGRLLDPARGRPFRDDFLPFAREVAAIGALSSLSQLVLKLTIPGVPDIYQGTELWDLNLVDPDNRRPVDYAARRAALAEPATTPEAVRALLANWPDGRIKLHVTARLLHLRRAQAALFADGGYSALAANGTHAAHVIAFARHTADAAIVAVVPRLTAGLCGDPVTPPLGDAVWGDTHIALPAHLAGGAWCDAITGAIPVVAGNTLLLGEVLRDCTVAVLHRAG